MARQYDGNQTSSPVNSSGADHPSPTPPLRCAECTSDNAQVRMAHWYRFPDEAALRDHADVSWGDKTNPLTGRSRVEDIILSYRNQRALWAGEDAPRDWQTGDRLTWQQAREQYHDLHRQAMARLAARPRRLAPSGSLDAPVQEIAARFSPDSNVWAKAHLEMIQQGYSRPGCEAQAIAWCEAMATRSPDDAADWQHEAAFYRERLHQRTAARAQLPHPLGPVTSQRISPEVHALIAKISQHARTTLAQAGPRGDAAWEAPTVRRAFAQIEELALAGADVPTVRQAGITFIRAIEAVLAAHLQRP